MGRVGWYRRSRLLSKSIRRKSGQASIVIERLQGVFELAGIKRLPVVKAMVRPSPWWACIQMY